MLFGCGDSRGEDVGNCMKGGCEAIDGQRSVESIIPSPRKKKKSASPSEVYLQLRSPFGYMECDVYRCDACRRVRERERRKWMYPGRRRVEGNE